MKYPYMLTRTAKKQKKSIDSITINSEILASVSLNLERTQRCFSFQLYLTLLWRWQVIQLEKKKKRNKHKNSRCMHMIHVWKWCNFIPRKSNPTNKLLETIRKEKWLNTKLIFKIHDSMRADMFVDKLFKDIVRYGIREKICRINYALSSFILKRYFSTHK